MKDGWIDDRKAQVENHFFVIFPKFNPWVKGLGGGEGGEKKQKKKQGLL